MISIKKGLLLILVVGMPLSFAYAGNKDEDGYKFEIIKELPHSTVKNQNRTGTCWSFAGMSFFETEMLRIGKPEVDLSEMFGVSRCYRDKARKYVRMQGNTTFGPGGELFDDLYIVDKYGLVPESAFPGIKYGEEKHVHGRKHSTIPSMHTWVNFRKHLNIKENHIPQKHSQPNFAGSAVEIMYRLPHLPITRFISSLFLKFPITGCGALIIMSRWMSFRR